jgi:dipeptidase E
MLLYLSSYRLGDDPARLRALAPAGGDAVVIANALDHTDDIPRKNAGTAREIRELQALGFAARELDLRACFGKPAVLEAELLGITLLWVVGGNAFLLRRAFRQSGLDAYLLSRQGDDALIYGGYSAGVVVVTPTLRGIDRVDSPNVVSAGYAPEVVWDGVGLVPFSIAPHYQSNHPESPLIDSVVEFFAAQQMPFEVLRDGEVIITRA